MVDPTRRRRRRRREEIEPPPIQVRGRPSAATERNEGLNLQINHQPSGQSRSQVTYQASGQTSDSIRYQANDETGSQTGSQTRSQTRGQTRRRDRLRTDEQARVRTDEQARVRTAEQARVRTAEQARVRTAEQARLGAAEQARLRTEEQARLWNEEQVRRLDEDRARHLLEEQTRRLEEARARRLLEEQARRQDGGQARDQVRQLASQQLSIQTRHNLAPYLVTPKRSAVDANAREMQIRAGSARHDQVATEASTFGPKLSGIRVPQQYPIQYAPFESIVYPANTAPIADTLGHKVKKAAAMLSATVLVAGGLLVAYIYGKPGGTPQGQAIPATRDAPAKIGKPAPNKDSTEKSTSDPNNPKQDSRNHDPVASALAGLTLTSDPLLNEMLVLPGTRVKYGEAKEITFDLAYQSGLKVDSDVFSNTVFLILNADQGWSQEGVKFTWSEYQPDIHIILTSDTVISQYCGGINQDGFASCVLQNKIYLNSARWVEASPEFLAAGGTTSEYRIYVLNYLVGLAAMEKSPEKCAGPGELAPVMLPQTLGLEGCIPNGWPYPSSQE